MDRTKTQNMKIQIYVYSFLYLLLSHHNICLLYTSSSARAGNQSEYPQHQDVAYGEKDAKDKCKTQWFHYLFSKNSDEWLERKKELLNNKIDPVSYTHLVTEEGIKSYIRKFVSSYSGSWSYPWGQNCHSFQKEMMNMCCIRAVSYTHLDVYKRQP